jgi:hypothetical protein
VPKPIFRLGDQPARRAVAHCERPRGLCTWQIKFAPAALTRPAIRPFAAAMLARNARVAPKVINQFTAWERNWKKPVRAEVL